MAQEVIYNPGYCAQFYPNANCQNKGPGNPYTGSYQRHLAYGAPDRGALGTAAGATAGRPGARERTASRFQVGGRSAAFLLRPFVDYEAFAAKQALSADVAQR